MRPPSARRVVLVAAETTFPGLAVRLRRHGVRLRRVLPFQAVPSFSPSARRRLLAFGPWDTLLVTSRATVDQFLVRPDVGPLLRDAPRPETLSVGPATTAALRRAGWAPRWSAGGAGATALARRLGRGRKRRILYPRSARAGPGLARRLRTQGHRVLDLVVYRLAPSPPWTPEEVQAVRRADRIVVTSPSALSGLRRGVGSREFSGLRRRGVLVVLGERSARAARGHGFRAVRVAPTLAEQGFTRFLLRELTDGP